jgi:hypothetical protein
VLQGDIVVLDVNSQQSGGPTVTTADDCCNECRKNSKVCLIAWQLLSHPTGTAWFGSRQQPTANLRKLT